MSWLSNLVYGKDSGQSATGAAMQDSTRQAGASAGRARDRYEADSVGFDPGAAFEKYSAGAFGDFKTGLSRQLRDLSGREAGAGRFDSGFFDEDQGQVVRDASSDFSNRIAQGALQTAGLRQSQIAQEGNYAAGQGQEYNDLLAGQLDRETADQNAKRRQRSDFWGGLFKGAGMAAAGL